MTGELVILTAPNGCGSFRLRKRPRSNVGVFTCGRLSMETLYRLCCGGRCSAYALLVASLPMGADRSRLWLRSNPSRRPPRLIGVRTSSGCLCEGDELCKGVCAPNDALVRCIGDMYPPCDGAVEACAPNAALARCAGDTYTPCGCAAGACVGALAAKICRIRCACDICVEGAASLYRIPSAESGDRLEELNCRRGVDEGGGERGVAVANWRVAQTTHMSRVEEACWWRLVIGCLPVWIFLELTRRPRALRIIRGARRGDDDVLRLGLLFKRFQ